jgi:hypothetical protein
MKDYKKCEVCGSTTFVDLDPGRGRIGPAARIWCNRCSRATVIHLSGRAFRKIQKRLAKETTA